MEEPSVRPIQPDRYQTDDLGRRTSRMVAPLLAVIAAALVLWWPNAVEEPPVEPMPIEPVMTIAAPIPPTPPAVESFEDFVAAVNRRDTEQTIELLAPQLPDVAGLGTFSYPLAGSDPGLWAAGELDATKVIGFVEEPVGRTGPVAVSNCSAFGDGPAVTIVACDYAAGGANAFPSFRPQRGKVFGFMVEATVAGVAYRTGTADPGPIR